MTTELPTAEAIKRMRDTLNKALEKRIGEIDETEFPITINYPHPAVTSARIHADGRVDLYLEKLIEFIPISVHLVDVKDG